MELGTAVVLLNKYLAVQKIASRISLSNTSWQEGLLLSVEAEQYDKILRRIEKYDESFALGEACQTVEMYFRGKRDEEARVREARQSAATSVPSSPSVVSFMPKPRVEEHKGAPRSIPVQKASHASSFEVTPPSYLESMGVTYTREQILAAIALVNAVVQIQYHLTLAIVLAANIASNASIINNAIIDASLIAAEDETSKGNNILKATELLSDVTDTIKRNSPPTKKKSRGMLSRFSRASHKGSHTTKSKAGGRTDHADYRADSPPSYAAAMKEAPPEAAPSYASTVMDQLPWAMGVINNVPAVREAGMRLTRDTGYEEAVDILVKASIYAGRLKNREESIQIIAADKIVNAYAESKLNQKNLLLLRNL